MFEQFTHDARRALRAALEEARGLHHGYIGTEHLLLGLMDVDGGTAREVLEGLGLSRDGVAGAVVTNGGTDDLDASALETLGIRLDDVRAKVEQTFGKGALDHPRTARQVAAESVGGAPPFTSRAKKVLELALREALRLDHREINDGHILLGLVREGDGLGMRVLADHGIDAERIRRELGTTWAA